MKRRSSASGKLPRSRRPPTPKSKSRDRPKAASSRSARGTETDVVQLRRELREAHEQQTATLEVLQAISSSPGDLEPVFASMLEKAVRICDAKFGVVYRCDGDVLRFVTMHNAPPDLVALGSHAPFRPSPKHYLGRMMASKTVVQVADVREEQGYIERRPEYVVAAELGGVRTYIAAPMLRHNDLIGVFLMGRQEVRPFTDKQIALVKSFAAQAVIAIENTRLFNEVQARTVELAEALEQQTATSEVLAVISRSPGDLSPVFDAMLGKAMQLCSAHFGVLNTFDGEHFHTGATYGLPPAYDEFRRGRLLDYGPGTAPARLLQGEPFVEIQDLLHTDAYRNGDPNRVALVDIGGARCLLTVPLLKEERVVGNVMIFRKEKRPFSEKQIALLQQFAAQAVIAIENTRLLRELRESTEVLRESLQQQTAVGDVLRTISRSSFDLQPVLDTLVATAAHLCDADMAFIMRRDGDVYKAGAAVGFTEEYVEFLKNSLLPVDRGSITGRAALERRTVQILDVANDPEYTLHQATSLAQQRTALGVPLLREDQPIGVIVIARKRVEAFTQKQIDLVTTFADQAVIAIENVRLFEQLRQRTDDLSESLQQQTATADVLKVISRSAFDLQVVLDTLTESAARLCDADTAFIFQRSNEVFVQAANFGFSGEFEEFVRQNPIKIGRGTVTGRAAIEGKTVHVADVLNDPEFTGSQYQLRGNFRTCLGVPLLKAGKAIGVFFLSRSEVRPFTQKQTELVTTFADQAVIAIENTRLLGELRERQAELRTTFDNMGDGVAMFDAAARLAAWNRNLQEMLDLPEALLAKRPSLAELFHYLAARGEFGSADLEAQLSLSLEDTRQEMRYERARPDGRVIEVRRNPVPDGGFVLIYADITERKRAEEAIRAARDAAETTLRELQTTQDRLVQTQKLASLGQLTAGIAHEIKNPLNFVNNFSSLSVELIDELQEALGRVQVDGKARAEITELADTLCDNLGKIVQHGKRADSIVKNMLLHAREGMGEHRPVDINALVEESLNLAYHGARAEKQGFKITLGRSFDPTVGQADVFPQDITRVLLNLISNGFDAVAKRKLEVDPGDFEPMLAAATRNLGDRVEIKIRDNGTGIPPDVKEKIFNPFFTTKPAGEGTGLGLSISHDIIVKQHAGSIEVDSRPGEFTEIRVILPRVSASPT